LKVGQEIDVYVLGINAQEKKIALSIKRTQAEPWSRVAANYEVGQLVRGTVTQLANFGAFARIEDGIEGLIHVSELVDDRVTHPKQVVSEGQDLLLRIIRIDPQRRRMGLSLRRALDTPDAELEAVFGDGVIAEKEALIEQIRQRLEAEGIELGDALSGGAAAPIEELPGERPAAAERPLTVADLPPTAAAQAAAEAEARGETAPAPKPAKPRAARAASPVELPDDLDGELSAMAVAFAMAGAPSDFVAEAAAEDEAEETAADGAPAPSDGDTAAG
jgi:predicted RNA-binding protein with RPS1 domain